MTDEPSAARPDLGPDLSLRREEAQERRALLDVTGYELDLDLTGADSPGAATYDARTVVSFTSGTGETFVDLKPSRLDEIRLDGEALDRGLLARGRFPLSLTEGQHRLEVSSTMWLRNDGEGLHRSIDPADDRAYLYAMSFMDAAPSISACFDQPDLKAPWTLRVTAPSTWEVLGNGRATRVDDVAGQGRWELATTQPLSTYFLTLVAGPYHVITAEHDGIALSLSARASLADALDREAEEILTLTRQSFDELHRLFGIRYPFGDYHQAFVPEFNAGAMENPGCVTFRDEMVFSSRVTRAARINRATTIAHEMAHQWFGNLVTPRWWDDLWLNESFAEYLGTRVTADATTYDDAWAHQASARRQWGLAADQRPSTHPVAGNGAQDAVSALQDFDGISYAKGSAVLKQLVARVGDEVFLGGVVEHLTQHRFGNATMADLVTSWEDAGAGDLSDFVDAWLRVPGLDTLTPERTAGGDGPIGVRRDPPRGPGSGTVRHHALSLAIGDVDGWRRHPVVVDSELTAVDLGGDPGDGSVVLVDPDEQTWAASCLDPTSLTALPARILTIPTDDPALLAAVWNNVRSAYRLGRLDPAAVVDAVVAAPPLADLGDTASFAHPWTTGALLPAAPAGSTARVHDALVAMLDALEPGGDDQLRVARGLLHTAEDPDLLRRWLLDGPPSGLTSDDDLRWRAWVRLAVLGATDRAELDTALAATPTSTARLEHTRAVASLPDEAAKRWAWDRFTGQADVGNHEVEAAGMGLWRPGQRELTAPYVERYAADLPATARVRSGWVLALSAAAYFPRSHVDEQTLAVVTELADHPDVPPAVRRRVVDGTDDLARALDVRRAFPVGGVS